MQASAIKHSKDPLTITAQAVTNKGWTLNGDEDTLFQENVFFTARTAHIGYNGNMSQLTDDVLHFELVVQLGFFSPYLRPPFAILLNLVNQYISMGAICHSVEEDGSEFLIHRAQLYFDSEVGVTENQVAGFMEASLHAYDLCLPHIAEFLAMKPRATFGPDGEIDRVQLKMDPEDVIDFIIAGPQVGHA